MEVVSEEKPDIIALGFDQDMEELKQELKSAGIECKLVRIGKFGDYSTRKILKEKKGGGG